MSCSYLDKRSSLWTNAGYEGRNMRRIEWEVKYVYGSCRNKSCDLFGKETLNTRFKNYKCHTCKLNDDVEEDDADE
jgi:hypothetical protein